MDLHKNDNLNDIWDSNLRYHLGQLRKPIRQIKLVIQANLKQDCIKDYKLTALDLLLKYIKRTNIKLSKKEFKKMYGIFRYCHIQSYYLYTD